VSYITVYKSGRVEKAYTRVGVWLDQPNFHYPRISVAKLQQAQEIKSTNSTVEYRYHGGRVYNLS
jgi:hypothetical protein